MLSGRLIPASSGPLVSAASLLVGVAGWLVAHGVAYRLVASGGEGSHAMVEGTGHGHLAFSSYVMAVSMGVLLLALAGAVVAGALGRTRPAVPLAPYVVLPLVDFVSHSVLESLRHGHVVSMGVALEPVFLVGLALQLPLALAALLLVRAGLGWAEGLGRGLTPRWRARPRALAPPAPPRLLIGTEHRPIISVLSSCCAGRGPPRFGLVR
jgi:hypothetical protein